MAKINNAQIIQKLVDELKLYPGKDLIPSELADKILAVYQVNDQEVSVKTPTANVVSNGIRTSSGTVVIFTAPATGKFFLTNAAISGLDRFVSDDGSVSITVVIDGATQILMKAEMGTGTGGAATPGHADLAYNFQNPILVDQGSVINLTLVGSIGYATIVGYTEPAI